MTRFGNVNDTSTHRTRNVYGSRAFKGLANVPAGTPGSHGLMAALEAGSPNLPSGQVNDIAQAITDLMKARIIKPKGEREWELSAN